jgi:phosphohistidine phosphatase SixA
LGWYNTELPQFAFRGCRQNEGMEMKSLLLCLIVAGYAFIVLPGCSATPQADPQTSNDQALVVFLVRHGEKADLSRDPALSDAGQERAVELARVLRDVQIDHVHSTDFIRTRDTASPTAAAHGVRVEVYDYRDLPGLADKLLKTRGHHLVVGHSNTTPPMVKLLGGDPVSEIDELGEFDRLYVVTVAGDGTASSVMLRYGKPFEGN